MVDILWPSRGHGDLQRILYLRIDPISTPISRFNPLPWTKTDPTKQIIPRAKRAGLRGQALGLQIGAQGGGARISACAMRRCWRLEHKYACDGLRRSAQRQRVGRQRRFPEQHQSWAAATEAAQTTRHGCQRKPAR